MINHPRILFLDDEPDRAATFLEQHPDAVWVQTAEQCLSRLAEPWDEVHLDHDLGGETFVDHDRDDCGMAVIRWLCQEPRPHLQDTRFIIHTHNENAACVMVLHLQTTGFDVIVRPFGMSRTGSPRTDRSRNRRPLLGRVIRWLQGRRDP